MGNVYEDSYQAVESLAYWGGELLQAVTGERPHVPNEKLRNGPFAQAMHAIAEIADTGKVTDPERAKKDMLTAMRFLEFVGGMPFLVVKPVIDAAMEAIGELIDTKEAAAILGDPEFMVDVYMRSQSLHPLYRNSEGQPIDGPWIARYEVEDYKARKETRARIIAEVKAKQGGL